MPPGTTAWMCQVVTHISACATPPLPPGCTDPIATNFVGSAAIQSHAACSDCCEYDATIFLGTTCSADCQGLPSDIMKCEWFNNPTGTCLEDCSPETIQNGIKLVNYWARMGYPGYTACTNT